MESTSIAACLASAAEGTRGANSAHVVCNIAYVVAIVPDAKSGHCLFGLDRRCFCASGERSLDAYGKARIGRRVQLLRPLPWQLGRLYVLDYDRIHRIFPSCVECRGANQLSAFVPTPNCTAIAYGMGDCGRRELRCPPGRRLAWDNSWDPRLALHRDDRRIVANRGASIRAKLNKRAKIAGSPSKIQASATCPLQSIRSSLRQSRVVPPLSYFHGFDRWYLRMRWVDQHVPLFGHDDRRNPRQ